MGPEYYLVDDEYYVPDHCHGQGGNGEKPGDGEITIKQGLKSWKFTVNQEGPTEINLDKGTPDSKLIIKQGGVVKGEFITNSNGATVIDIDECMCNTIVLPGPIYYGASIDVFGQPEDYRELTVAEIKNLPFKEDITNLKKHVFAYGQPTGDKKYFYYFCIPSEGEDLVTDTSFYMKDSQTFNVAMNDPYYIDIDGLEYIVYGTAQGFDGIDGNGNSQEFIIK